MIIYNKLDNYFVVSADRQTFLGFEMTAPLKTYLCKPMLSHFQNFRAVVGFANRLAGATSYFYRDICLRKRKEFVFQCTKFCADILLRMKTEDFLLNYIRISEAK